jgi:hypothetical protein
MSASTDSGSTAKDDDDADDAAGEDAGAEAVAVGVGDPDDVLHAVNNVAAPATARTSGTVGRARTGDLLG